MANWDNFFKGERERSDRVKRTERERERERERNRKISDIDGQTDRQTDTDSGKRQKSSIFIVFFSALLSVESFVWLISMSSRMFARPFRIIKRRQICNV